MMKLNNRSIRNALCILLLVAVQPAVYLPAVAYPILGIFGHTIGVPTMNHCTVVADDAWSFDEIIFVVNDTYTYLNTGTRGSADVMYCGPFQFGVECPTHMASAGPHGGGAAWFDDPSGTTFPELRSDYRASWQDCSSAGELTVSYHIKPMTDKTTYGAIGSFRTHAVSREGVFFSGINKGFIGPNDDRICMNIAGVVDLNGAADGPIGCGDGSDGFPYGEGANTENNPGDNLGTNLQYNTWAHVALTFSDEGEQGAGNGRYLVYVDGALINSLDSAITGDIPNTTNRWTIGLSVTPDITTFMIANLQIECVEWDLARVNEADECDVPDQ